MVQVTLEQARALVAPMDGQVRVTHQDGMTSQIIAEILDVSAHSAGQTARLAEKLQGATPLESCENVFSFVRKRVRYVLDPAGKQLVKTPAAVIGTGFCDCKGYATLTNDLLRCLGIECAFRFVSFKPGSQNVSHVYSVAWPTPGGPLVVLDACLPRFNQEKPYAYHEDHMTQISRVSGIGRYPKRRRRNPYLHISGLESNEELTLKLHREGALLERDQAVRVQGIGSVAVGRHQAAVNDYNEALGALYGGDDAVAGFLRKLRGRLVNLRTARREQKAVGRLNPFAQLRNARQAAAPSWVRRVLPAQVNGPDFVAPRLDREERRIGFLKKLFSKVKNVVKKAGQGIAKGAKAVAKTAAKGAKVVAKAAVKAGKFALKVALLPAQLLTKALLELFLPKIGPMFLYLFITNQDTIASLPAAAARKRRKALKFAQFITNVVGMKEAHFMKACRNSIQKQMGGTPEEVLSRTVKGPISGINGIGFAPLVALLPMVMKLIDKIASLFGKKPDEEETPTEADVPDPSADFAEAPAKVVRKVVAHVKRKPASQRGEEPDTYRNEMAQEAEEKAVLRAVDAEPANTPADAPLPDPAPEPDYAEPTTDELADDYPTDETPADDSEEVSGIAGNYL